MQSAWDVTLSILAFGTWTFCSRLTTDVVDFYCFKDVSSVPLPSVMYYNADVYRWDNNVKAKVRRKEI